MHIPLKTKVYFSVLAVVAGLIMAALMTACSGDQLLGAYLAANRDGLQRPAIPAGNARPMQFVVQPGTPARTIAENLANAGLIGDAKLFEAYVRVNGLADRLQAGTYTLSPNMTPVQIAEVLQHALAPNMTITIPEGWRLEQIADYLTRTGALDGAEYRRLAASPDEAWRLSHVSGAESGRYAFLDSRSPKEGATLEGYLFPDTYQLPADGATADDLLTRQLDNFAAQVLPAYSKAVAEGATRLSLHEVVTLASIVEREAVVDEERPIVAGVYLNRLAAGMKLEADPTVQYAMGYQPDSQQWWKTPVSLEEYGRVESPYNTYLHPGLPPSPIANPGIGSIRAVLYPARHDYLYFVAAPDGSGRHLFSRTFEEHLEKVKRYQGR